MIKIKIQERNLNKNNKTPLHIARINGKNQMALLFDRDEKTIRKHINNVFNDGETDNSNTQKMRIVILRYGMFLHTNSGNNGYG